MNTVYFKRGVQPKCEVQAKKCGVQNEKMRSPTFDILSFTIKVMDTYTS